MERLLGGRLPTSLDSMSPKNPVLLALADIPVAPTIKAHSIIPVKGDGDLQKGRDGVVAYTSAHVDYVESELVVRGPHSCQNLPATIEEVRSCRITIAGAFLENMWLKATALGLGFQLVSVTSRMSSDPAFALSSGSLRSMGADGMCCRIILRMNSPLLSGPSGRRDVWLA